MSAKACPSCHSENYELLSAVHALQAGAAHAAHLAHAAVHAAPPQASRGAYHLGVWALLSLVPALLHSPWWLALAALLGLAALTAGPIERRHHAEAMRQWSSTCICLDCGASWPLSDLEGASHPEALPPALRPERKVFEHSSM